MVSSAFMSTTCWACSKVHSIRNISREKNTCSTNLVNSLTQTCPDIVADPPNLEGEVHCSVNEGNDAPVSEPPIPDNEDPNEDER